MAARREASERPTFMTMSGTPASAAAVAARAKSCGRRKPSTNIMIAVLRPSRTRYSTISSASTSASLPAVTTWRTGRCMRRARLYRPKPRPPLWEMMLTPLRSSSSRVAAPASSSTTMLKLAATAPATLKKPSVFGPRIRMPVRRAISAMRSCSGAWPSRSVADPALNTTAAPTPAAAHSSSACVTSSAATATMARSTRSGTAAMEGQARRPWISACDGLTG
jgi:hypothetical protein